MGSIIILGIIGFIFIALLIAFIGLARKNRQTDEGILFSDNQIPKKSKNPKYSYDYVDRDEESMGSNINQSGYFAHKSDSAESPESLRSVDDSFDEQSISPEVMTQLTSIYRKMNPDSNLQSHAETVKAIQKTGVLDTLHKYGLLSSKKQSARKGTRTAAIVMFVLLMFVLARIATFLLTFLNKS